MRLVRWVKVWHEDLGKRTGCGITIPIAAQRLEGIVKRTSVVGPVCSRCFE